MKSTFHGWDYSIEKMEVKPILTIKPSKEIIYPTTLSKYYALNKNNIHTLVNSEIYACRPEEFNDMFDSNFLLVDFRNVSFAQIMGIFTGVDLIRMRDQYDNDPQGFMDRFRNNTYSDWNERSGISCFTTNQLNELMWAHYTMNSGYLIEYDYSLFPKNMTGPYPINYTNELSLIDASNVNPILAFMASSTIKKNIWEYENEFRFIIYPDSREIFETTGRFSNHDDSSRPKSSRLIKHSKGAIKKIIFGFNFFKHESVSKELPRIIRMESENAFYKCILLNYVIENNIEVENIFWHNFNLKNVKIEIERLDVTTYKLINI